MLGVISQHCIREVYLLNWTCRYYPYYFTRERVMGKCSVIYFSRERGSRWIVTLLILLFLLWGGFYWHQPIACGEEPETVVGDDRGEVLRGPDDASLLKDDLFCDIDRMTFRLHSSFLDRLPSTGNVSAHSSILPGVLYEGGLMINGASQYENTFSIEGFEVTLPVGSYFASRLLLDSLENVTVTTGGISTDRGRALGATIDFELDIGDKEWHGGSRTRFSSSTLSTPAGPGKPAVGSFERYRQSLWINGPLAPEMVWLSIAHEHDYSRIPRELPFYRSPDTGEYSFTTVAADEQFQALSATLSAQKPGHDFLFLFLGSEGLRHNQASEIYTPEAQAKLTMSERLFGLKWDARLSPTLSHFTSIHVHSLFRQLLPEHTSLADPVWDGAASLWFRNFPEKRAERQERFSAVSRTEFGTYFWSAFHTFSLGLEFNRLAQRRDLESTTGKYYETKWFNTDQAKPYFRRESIFTDTSEVLAELSAPSLTYRCSVTDTLDLEAGLRWEYASFWDTRRHVVNVFKDTYAPHLAVEWTFDEARGSTVFGSAGRYYNLYDLSLVYSECELIYEWYRYDPSNPYADEEGYYWQEYIPGYIPPYEIDRELKAEHTDEVVFGTQIPVRSNVLLGLNLIFRHTADIIEDVIFYTDEAGVVHLATDVDLADPAEVENWYQNSRYADTMMITNPDDAYRDYYAMQLYQTYTGDRSSVLLSYTYSETRGRQWKPLFDQDSLEYASHWETAFDTPYLTQSIDGRLPFDSPHVLKLNTVSRLPLDFSVGTSLLYRSGYTYNRYGTLLPGPDSQTGTADDIDNRDPIRGQGVRYVSQRGSYRLPDVFLVDISLQRDFHLGPYGTVTAIIDLFNLFDNQTVQSRNELDGQTFGEANAWNAPRSISFQLKYTF